jgi:DNA-binding transcriptional LysR family regulator
MKLELRHLRVLVAVAEQRGYTRAARLLGISQSTASESIAALERNLGTPLLRRSSRGAEPTESGALLLPYARQMLDLEAEALARLAEQSRELRITLRIGTHESLTSYLLPTVLSELRQRWPQVQVDIASGSCRQIREWLRDGDVELGLVLEGDPPPGWRLALERLGGMRLRLFIRSPAAKLRLAFSDLHGRDLYLSGTAGTYHDLLQRLFADAGFPRPPLHSVGSVEAVKRQVRLTEGAIGVLPEIALRDELAQGTFALLDVPVPDLSLHALTPPGRPQPPPAADLLELLRQTITRTAAPAPG